MLVQYVIKEQKNNKILSEAPTWTLPMEYLRAGHAMSREITEYRVGHIYNLDMS